MLWARFIISFSVCVLTEHRTLLFQIKKKKNPTTFIAQYQDLLGFLVLLGMSGEEEICLAEMKGLT